MKLDWHDKQVYGGIINTSITVTETDALVHLASGGRIVEIGAAYGYSTVILASIAEHVDSIDPHETHNSLETLRNNLYMRGLESYATIHVGTSQEVLPTLTGPFDMVFIDGDHTAPGIRHDVLWAIANAPVVACHDYGEDSCPDVKGVLDELFPKGPTRLVESLWILKEG